ncbi:hypothetical protein SCLCIDRAFT_299996 [Scleroderma citrinum Foug A]|uniref:Uncharacterized protein n=1 Tax=Scleroderma citrinum Foug A TaxID=1036808 RepID=A0A0C2Z0T4_9AGAM|nr:hypothetical protein SCLCIDRAFT_299996 [Scleroderma citrinum Foug A]
MSGKAFLWSILVTQLLPGCSTEQSFTLQRLWTVTAFSLGAPEMYADVQRRMDRQIWMSCSDAWMTERRSRSSH